GNGEKTDCNVGNSESSDRVENSERIDCNMDKSKSDERVENSQSTDCNLGDSGPARNRLENSERIDCNLGSSESSDRVENSERIDCNMGKSKSDDKVENNVKIDCNMDNGKSPDIVGRSGRIDSANSGSAVRVEINKKPGCKVGNSKPADDGSVENNAKTLCEVGNTEPADWVENSEKLNCNIGDCGSADNESGNKAAELTSESYVGKYVLVNFNEKPYVGLVAEARLSSVLVDCMHRNGKIQENSFSWPRKLKDKSWYQLSSIIAIVKCLGIPGRKHKFKLEDESWAIYLKHVEQNR
ncbi:MAG: hypothetical protein JAZ03_14245, partial [Candidatus Thiodiazotropha taylori]|nr:hypothetical protein [Candidatus Thiodiazotropha taylori]MCW4335091.1 hypothetical protein [Candidatus Thiodiazotropha endolucinida]